MDRIAIIRTEAQRFADVLSTTARGTPCPTCPAWDAADLLWHLTEVHYFWAGVLARNARTEADVRAVEQAKPARPDAFEDLLAARADATASLLAELARLDDAERRWSWWDADQTVGFTRRMQTYEATMHRADAELTAGLPLGPVSAEVAAGAVDHAVDVMWGWQPEGATYSPRAVAQFTATDTGQRWLVEFGVSGEWPRAARAVDARPTATVTGAVADLAWWAWRRGGSVDVSGAPESVAAVRAVVNRGMP